MKELAFLVLMGRHPYGMSPEEETEIARYWLVAGLLFGLSLGALGATLK